jgi:SAM-dependent methyltransferase
MDDKAALKNHVKEFWNEKSCGEVYAAGLTEREYYDSARRERYKLEPYIFEFAGFQEGRNKDVLEIGVGMGADHAEWARSGPRSLTGVDLTPRAISHTRKRFQSMGLASDLRVADAERLPFTKNSFDLVYSWGVLHHSPNTDAAINEVFRVLRPGGRARIMIYHRYSLTGYMLWLRFGLFSGRPSASLDEIYHDHLESPGTKAYSIEAAEDLFSQFSKVKTEVELGCGDLLEGAVGQRHQGRLLALAKALWPRRLVRRFLRNHGLLLLIDAEK